MPPGSAFAVSLGVFPGHPMSREDLVGMTGKFPAAVTARILAPTRAGSFARLEWSSRSTRTCLSCWINVMRCATVRAARPRQGPVLLSLSDVGDVLVARAIVRTCVILSRPQGPPASRWCSLRAINDPSLCPKRRCSARRQLAGSPRRARGIPASAGNNDRLRIDHGRLRRHRGWQVAPGPRVGVRVHSLLSSRDTKRSLAIAPRAGTTAMSPDPGQGFRGGSSTTSSSTCWSFSTTIGRCSSRSSCRPVDDTESPSPAASRSRPRRGYSTFTAVTGISRSRTSRTRNSPLSVAASPFGTAGTGRRRHTDLPGHCLPDLRPA